MTGRRAREAAAHAAGLARGQVISAEVSRLIADEYREGATVRFLAHKYGIALATTAHHIRKHGLEPDRRRSEAQRRNLAAARLARVRRYAEERGDADLLAILDSPE